jgi:hypothetical protein
MQAIANVYEEAVRQDKDARKVNPVALWDLHHLRRLDDMGFVDGLYGRRNAPDRTHDSHHDHDHDHHAHAAPGQDAVGNITASGAVVSPDCDDDCSPTH